jgi:hypothetical protein
MRYRRWYWPVRFDAYRTELLDQSCPWVAMRRRKAYVVIGPLVLRARWGKP